MKRIITLCLLAFAYQQVNAQEEKVSQYIFKDFENGTVKFKAGADATAKLNYNTIREEMLFKNGDSILVLSKENKVDTVYISQRKFIPMGDIFYEAIAINGGLLYVRHISTLNTPAVETGRGVMKTAGQNAVASAKYEVGGTYNFMLPEYDVKRRDELYLKKGNKFVYLKTPGSLGQFYPGKEARIKQVMQDHKTDFTKVEDVVSLLNAL